MKKLAASLKILTVFYVLVLAAIIFVADKKSTRYLLDFVGNVPYGDKFGHFILMGTFSLLLNLALGARSVGFAKIRYLLGSIIVAIVVAAEEISQLFIRGRSFDWSDLAVDFAGIVIFGEVARLLSNRHLQGTDSVSQD